MTLLSCQIPFTGFYESLWSSEMDREEEQLIEYVAEEPTRYAPEIVAAQQAGTLGELLAAHTDYRKAEALIASAYVEAFVGWLSETLDYPARETVPYEYEELTSPRFYNFETDRLFAKLDSAALDRIRSTLWTDAPETFRETVRDFMQSRDGFASFYSADAADPDALAAKPLDEWDHNELHVLLQAWGRHVRSGETAFYGSLDSELFDRLSGWNAVGNAVAEAQDWPAITAAARSLVADQWDDLPEPVREAYLHPRCELTLDLPL